MSLGNMVRTYFDSTRNGYKFPLEKIKASTFYMWSAGMPLFAYREKVLPKDSTASELKKWASMGPLYKDYGSYILRQYPLQFVEHFVLPNTVKYYAPPPEFMEYYNMGYDSVTPLAKAWFGYKDAKISTRIVGKKASLLEIYPVLIGTMNMVLVACLLCFISLQGFRPKTPFSKTILIIAVIWLLNAAFTILSSPAAIRLQAFALVLETATALILVDWLWKLAHHSELLKDLKKQSNSARPETNNQAIA